MQGRVRINKAACVSTHLIYLIFRQTLRVPPADPHAQGQPARAGIYHREGDVSSLAVSLPSLCAICACISASLSYVLLCTLLPLFRISSHRFRVLLLGAGESSKRKKKKIRPCISRIIERSKGNICFRLFPGINKVCF